MARNIAPMERLSQSAPRPRRMPPATRCADHATKRFQKTLFTLKSTPSAAKASALCGASAAMNCGTNARKKSATFGLSALVRKPCQKTVESRARQLHEEERLGRCHDECGQADRRRGDVHEAPAEDAERGDGARAKPLGR